MEALALRPTGPSVRWQPMIESGIRLLRERDMTPDQTRNLDTYMRCLRDVRCAELAKIASFVADDGRLGKYLEIAAAGMHVEYGLTEGRHGISSGTPEVGYLIGRDLAGELRLLFNYCGVGLRAEMFYPMALDTITMATDSVKALIETRDVQRISREHYVMIDALEKLKDTCRTCAYFGDKELRSRFREQLLEITRLTAWLDGFRGSEFLRL